jgi:hypothetical protein
MPFRWRRKSGSGNSSWKAKIKSLFRRKKRKEEKANDVSPEQTTATTENPDALIQPTRQQSETKPETSAQTTAPKVEPKDEPRLELNEDLIQTLFSGAPQFSINDDENPSVAFPWDKDLVVRDAIDYAPIEHPAFSSCTARRHLVPGISVNRGIPEYEIGTVEIPNMLSAQGKEPGTVGFEYFLQDPISDALREDEQNEGVQESLYDSLETLDLLHNAPEKLGIRKFSLEVVGERLMELATTYQEYRDSSGRAHLLKKHNAGELYSMLFSQLLMPPKFDSSADDPTGIKVQIQVLLRILKLQSIWFDFSSVEWRIRIGQILYTDFQKSEPNDLDNEVENGRLNDRHTLILQITLACELLLRLDAISAISAEEVRGDFHLSKEEIVQFRKRESPKTRWDLLLARTFLRNIEVKTTKMETMSPQQSRILGFFSMGPSHPEKSSNEAQGIALVPQNLEQQISGLFYFAKAISWPDREDTEKRFRSNLQKYGKELEKLPDPSIYGTPMESPRSVMTGQSNYFENRPQISRSSTPRSFLLLPSSSSESQSITGKEKGNGHHAPIGGWLTRTYITGLVLPGEAITHLLISAIVENDSTAIAKLGDSAWLYGGIVYRNRSWWSKTCIVGRVMAAVKGSKECMGWIYVPKAPTSVQDGWFDIQSNVPDPPSILRIKEKQQLREDADFLAGKKVVGITPDDFVMPTDPADSPSSTMWFDGLYLKPTTTDFTSSANVDEATETDETSQPTPPLPLHQASLRFISSTSSSTPPLPPPPPPTTDTDNDIGNSQTPSPELHIPLLHLVHFVSAHPCFPLPSSSMLRVFRRDGGGESEALSGHPLHVSHVFRIIKADELFSDAVPVPGVSLEGDNAATGPESEENEEGEDVERAKETLVVDARHDASLELLARAWCSWKGEHAVIGRVKVTCLACCVREARALGIRIIIRVE